MDDSPWSRYGVFEAKGVALVAGVRNPPFWDSDSVFAMVVVYGDIHVVRSFWTQMIGAEPAGDSRN